VVVEREKARLWRAFFALKKVSCRAAKACAFGETEFRGVLKKGTRLLPHKKGL
jgi:hypothetical protein